MNLEQRIEEYLLSQPLSGWVKADVLCARFEINERQLRKVGNQEGLCSAFAISGDKGFKHVTKATTSEYKRFKHRLRKHAINELRRVSRLDQRRHQVITTTKRPEFIREKDTGQGLMFDLPCGDLPF